MNTKELKKVAELIYPDYNWLVNPRSDDGLYSRHQHNSIKYFKDPANNEEQQSVIEQWLIDNITDLWIRHSSDGFRIQHDDYRYRATMSITGLSRWELFQTVLKDIIK